MQIISNAFEHEEKIPDQYTYNGGNKFPPLSWKDVPEGTKSFALIVEDPDAPSDVFTHWLAFNIPANQNNIAENNAGQFAQGKNDFGSIGYGGPRPPEGHGPHSYYFKLYAVDTPLDAEPGIDKGALLGIMENHILDKADAIICTGSHRRIPEPFKAVENEIFTTDNILEQRDLPETIAVIGLGNTGVEFAQALAVQKNMTVQELLDMPFYHPTLEEGLRSALTQAAKNLKKAA